MSGDGRIPGTVAEHRALLAARRGGRPFLALTDDDGAQMLVILDGTRSRITIGRGRGSEVGIGWDARVSRVHAVVERLGRDWVISDDGLSRNGTYVNEVRILRGHRLRDGDVVRVGHSTITFIDPSVGATEATAGADEREISLTPAQERVLVALCRPYLSGDDAALPASNDQIAAELVLSLDAVKAHLRNLFRTFEIDQFPQVQKRVTLARIALDAGIVRRGQ